jgi:hypothetical protein
VKNFLPEIDRIGSHIDEASVCFPHIQVQTALVLQL